MYEVIFYKDKNEKEPIRDYIYELSQQNSKDARIKLKKIFEYIGQLKAYGVSAGKPAIDHIADTDLYELRPTSDRIFFVYWKDNTFVLLHHFVKKTQKTPAREIEQAQRNLKDFLEGLIKMSKKINGTTYTTFDDLWNDPELLTDIEKEEIQLKIDFIGKLIEAREEKGISQKRLAEMSGLKQPAIARLERMQATPQIDTLFKILKPLGYTLEIVPDKRV